MFWLLISFAACAVSLGVILTQLREIDDAGTRFLCLAVWLRMTLGAFADYTAPNLAAGLSINAVSTIGIIAGGWLLMEHRLLALRALAAVYFYLSVCIVSGVLNGGVAMLFPIILNWSYMLMLALLLYGAIVRHGCDRALRLLFPAFALPVALGLLSFLAGFGQVAENDGSVSYRGGYLHESVYAITVFTSLAIALLIRWRRAWLRYLFTGMVFAAIFLANYRTSIIALAPVIAMLGYGAFTAMTPARFRASAGILAVVLGLVAATALVDALPDRYADLLAVSQLDNVDITQPQELTDAERRLFSSRIYVWSRYISEYLEGGLLRTLVGYGPGAWTRSETLTAHAHNNLIFDLYNIGLIGLGALLTLYGAVLVRAWRLRDGFYARNLIAVMLGFIVMSMATSPFNVVEGYIFYVVMIGVVAGVAAEAEADAMSGDDYSPEPEPEKGSDPTASVALARGDRAIRA